MFNIAAAVRLSGPLNTQALEQSFNEIIRRHEALRTTFSSVNGQPAQHITAEQSLKMERLDLSTLNEQQREEEARRLAREEAARPFTLAEGPLLRAVLVQLDAREHVILLTMHHIVSDGWSMGVLIHEVTVLYESFSRSLPSPLPELTVQYADYAQWQREWLRGETLEAQMGYWRYQLANIPPPLQLPGSRQSPAKQTYRSREQYLELPASLTDEIKAFSRQQGVTLFMTLLAAFKTMLHIYTGEEDILVGSDVANRSHARLEHLIGFFVNQLVLRTDFSEAPTVTELLTRVREVTLGAYDNQDVPFEKLVEVLRPERQANRSPLFQIKFSLQNTPRPGLTFSELTISPLNVESLLAQNDLFFFVWDSAEGLRGMIQYNTDIVEDDFIRKMLVHFERLLRSMLAQPGTRLKELEMYTEEEKAAQIKEQANRNQTVIGKLFKVKPQAINLSPEI
jgi:non-ribosomal peptide synthetase component F